MLKDFDVNAPLMRQPVPHDFRHDIEAVGRIEAVPRILDVICKTTGMGFAAVARVTCDRWVACMVQDDIHFGIRPGDELDITTTICNEIRESRRGVVINHVAQDPVFHTHPTPALYGIESYISQPIILKDGTFFGTLCAIDPRPAVIDNPQTINMFKLFADLIAQHLMVDGQLRSAQDELEETQDELEEERETARLREQFIAVLGHDLRNPVAAFQSGIRLLADQPLDQRGQQILGLLQGSVSRMDDMIRNMLDFARLRLGSGVTLHYDADRDLSETIEQVALELKAANLERRIEIAIPVFPRLSVDHNRIAQMLSNLIGNAITHGDPEQPIRIGGSLSDNNLTIYVANGGRPIPQEAMAHLFEAFYRRDQGKSKDGLGLGLFIASEIARVHGGTLAVASDDAETRFTCTLPI